MGDWLKHGAREKVSSRRRNSVINIFSAFTFYSLKIQDPVKFRYFGSTLRNFWCWRMRWEGIRFSKFWTLFRRIVRQRSIRWKEY